MDRDARASQRKAEKEFREAHEFDFQPKSLTKSAARTRSLDQFLRDQQSFQTRQAQNASKVKEGLEAEARQ